MYINYDVDMQTMPYLSTQKISLQLPQSFAFKKVQLPYIVIQYLTKILKVITMQASLWALIVILYHTVAGEIVSNKI